MLRAEGLVMRVESLGWTRRYRARRDNHHPWHPVDEHPHEGRVVPLVGAPVLCQALGFRVQGSEFRV